MSDVFISYSRKDHAFVRKLFDKLIDDHHGVWVDWEGIPVTADWWGAICAGIEGADNFIFITSTSSLESPVCHLELAHATRNNKRIIPVVIAEPDEKAAFGALAARNLDDNTLARLEGRDILQLARDNWKILSRHNWIDMREAAYFDERFRLLVDAIGTDLEHVRQHTRLLVRAEEWLRQDRNADYLLRGEDLHDARAWLERSREKRPAPTQAQLEYVQASAAEQLRQATLEEQRKRELADAAERAARAQDESERSARRARLAGRLLAALAVIAAVVGILSLASVINAQTAVTNTQNTLTPVQGTLRAWNTEVALARAQVATANFEGTVYWLELNRARTLVAGVGPSGLALVEGRGTPAALLPTLTKIADMNAWSPQLKEFDGVEMVLVPAGCFYMGSELGESDEQPVHRQCFENSFWIDRYEVTNEQFARFRVETKSQSFFNLPNRPRDSITWFEARDYCAGRGARLPSEAEWEYAARGPDSRTYPWGDAFVPDNVVYFENANNQTADVGSRPGGVSWVGALDMSGNAWEWVSSLEKPYPYVAGDGREDLTDTTARRMLRGGAWSFSPIGVRVARRGWAVPDYVNFNIGLRCARDF